MLARVIVAGSIALVNGMVTMPREDRGRGDLGRGDVGERERDRRPWDQGLAVLGHDRAEGDGGLWTVNE